MSVVDEKVKLRKEMKARKSVLTTEQKEEKARAVFNALFANDYFQRSRVILGYWALPDELPTAHYLNQMSTRRQILLPVVKGDELELHRYTGPECLVAQPPYGILEPQDTEVVDPWFVELILVPGVAFDLDKRRLGRGKGYYDRLFVRTPNARRIGLCFREQIVHRVPSEPHDAVMDSLLFA
ncbi:MAG: 5-formyltetrahydrofolate cyclo-ligase [Bacteroides sp.]